MRVLLLVCLFTLGCATTPPPAPCPEVKAPPPVAAAPVAPPTLSEAALKEKSHAFFDAVDKADAAAYQAAITPGFRQFLLGRSYEGKLIKESLEGRVKRNSPVRSRTWNDERFFTSAGVAQFIGEAVENFPPEGDMPGGEMTRWHTLIWVYDGQDWKVAHHQLQAGGKNAERDMWNETLKVAVFNRKPNQTLVDAVKGRKPGTALDLAAGQGRNAVYLATQGWKTTAMDFADEGLKLAQEGAAKEKVKLTTVVADMETYDLGTNQWDLVTLIYAGDDMKMVEKMKASVKKNGLVVVEFFQKEATQGTGIGGFAPGQLAEAFKDGWKILRNDESEDIADWGLRKTKLVRFVAQKQ